MNRLICQNHLILSDDKYSTRSDGFWIIVPCKTTRFYFFTIHVQFELVSKCIICLKWILILKVVFRPIPATATARLAILPRHILILAGTFDWSEVNLPDTRISNDSMEASLYARSSTWFLSCTLGMLSCQDDIQSRARLCHHHHRHRWSGTS